jgi:hypothetical protein
MAIKFKAKAKEEIPVELQSLYVERDGAFMLDVEGAVDKARVDEFRNSNVALMQETTTTWQKSRPAKSGPWTSKQRTRNKRTLCAPFFCHLCVPASLRLCVKVFSLSPSVKSVQSVVD